MSAARDALAAIRASAASAGWIWLNPPTSTPQATRDRALDALCVVLKRARLPRHPALDVERVADAADAADRASAWLTTLADASTCPTDRAVILAPAIDLARAAAAARAALAPDDVALADAATRSAAAYALAARAARAVARC